MERVAVVQRSADSLAPGQKLARPQSRFRYNSHRTEQRFQLHHGSVSTRLSWYKGARKINAPLASRKGGDANVD
jgi:hypothetical protein